MRVPLGGGRLAPVQMACGDAYSQRAQHTSQLAHLLPAPCAQPSQARPRRLTSAGGLAWQPPASGLRVPTSWAGGFSGAAALVMTMAVSALSRAWH